MVSQKPVVLETLDRRTLIELSKSIGLAEALDSGKQFRIQIAGERISVPVDAGFNIEYEREGDMEEIKFQIKWYKYWGQASR